MFIPTTMLDDDQDYRQHFSGEDSSNYRQYQSLVRLARAEYMRGYGDAEGGLRWDAPGDDGDSTPGADSPTTTSAIPEIAQNAPRGFLDKICFNYRQNQLALHFIDEEQDARSLADEIHYNVRSMDSAAIDVLTIYYKDISHPHQIETIAAAANGLGLAEGMTWLVAGTVSAVASSLNNYSRNVFHHKACSCVRKTINGPLITMQDLIFAIRALNNAVLGCNCGLNIQVRVEVGRGEKTAWAKQFEDLN